MLEKVHVSYKENKFQRDATFGGVSICCRIFKSRKWTWMILELVNASIHNPQTLHLYNKNWKNLPPTSCKLEVSFPYKWTEIDGVELTPPNQGADVTGRAGPIRCKAHAVRNDTFRVSAWPAGWLEMHETSTNGGPRFVSFFVLRFLFLHIYLDPLGWVVKFGAQHNNTYWKIDLEGWTLTPKNGGRLGKYIYPGVSMYP